MKLVFLSLRMMVFAERAWCSIAEIPAVLATTQTDCYMLRLTVVQERVN